MNSDPENVPDQPVSNTITLPTNFVACDRGNTLLTNEENWIAWIKLPGSKQLLEIALCPENYPSLQVAILDEEKSSDEALAKHIMTNCAGWWVRKCNVAGVKIKNKQVEEE